MPIHFNPSGPTSVEGNINQPPIQGFTPGATGFTVPTSYTPSYLAGTPQSVNTGNEFLGGVPAYPPQPFDAPLQQPTMFNMQPYVETFNTAFPTTMNPAYNIDNITNVDQTLMQRLFSQWLMGGTSPFGPGPPQNGNE